MHRERERGLDRDRPDWKRIGAGVALAFLCAPKGIGISSESVADAGSSHCGRRRREAGIPLRLDWRADGRHRLRCFHCPETAASWLKYPCLALGLRLRSSDSRIELLPEPDRVPLTSGLLTVVTAEAVWLDE